MLRFYRIDLLDLWRGTLTPRRLVALLVGLPDESALRRAQRGDAAEWGLLEHLTAALVDDVRVGNYQRARIAGSTDAEVPAQIPRPGVKTREPITLTDAQADALLALGPRRDDEEVI